MPGLGNNIAQRVRIKDFAGSWNKPQVGICHREENVRAGVVLSRSRVLSSNREVYEEIGFVRRFARVALFVGAYSRLVPAATPPA